MGRLPPGQPLLARAAVSLAAPHDQRRRPGRRRHHAGAGRNLAVPQRRVVSRRAARVQSPHAGSAAPAAGRRHRHDLAGAELARRFPANFMLIAALNPCPCGYRNDPRRECHCTVPQIERYMAKISGPLLDRIDIHIEVPAVPFKELSAERAGTIERPDARARRRRPRASRRSASPAARRATTATCRSRQIRAVLPAERRVPRICCAASDERTGPLGPGPRQDSPRRPHDRRPGRQRHASSRTISAKRSTTGCSTGSCGRSGGSQGSGVGRQRFHSHALVGTSGICVLC